MLDMGEALLCRAEWLPAPLCCTRGAQPTRLSSYRKEESDPAMLQCLVRVNRKASSESSFPSHGFTPLQHKVLGLSLTTLLVNTLQTYEVQVFQYTWPNILLIQT